jgi:antitoxin PrlF
MSITLTVTAKGQITLRKSVLEHLGIGPGDKLEIDLLPAGRIEAKAKSGSPVAMIFGLMKREGERPATLADINEASAAGWAGER